MKFIDFFSGIGGFTEGMEQAGHECAGHCEFDKYAEASYRSMHTITETQREYLLTLDKKKRVKEIMKDEYLNGEWFVPDVRHVRADNIPKAECWCFGFPCQDISIAGKTLGFAGKRSSLFFAVTGIIRDIEEEDRPDTLSTVTKDNLLMQNNNLRIRKLTPKECFRLQGWSDDMFAKAEQMNSDSQLYKEAGNGVTVNVIYDIAKRL